MLSKPPAASTIGMLVTPGTFATNLVHTGVPKVQYRAGTVSDTLCSSAEA